MMFTKTTAFAAAIALSATSAFAGGLANEIVEAPVMEEAVAPVAGPSIEPAYIVVGILAALLIAAAVNNDDGDDDSDPTPPEENGAESAGDSVE